MATRVAIKVDVDTYRGTRDGVPALLEELARAKVRASFFFTLGPDRSGLAVLRVFRRRGFLAKMLRTNPARMYGWRTLLYGTLLPAPLIGRRCEQAIRAVRDAGHEVGLHAWDHVRWQDRLERLTPAEIARELELGCGEFERILGASPRAFAAPAWLCSDAAFSAIEALGLDYMSVGRGAVGPFHPVVCGRALRTIEVPTTLPTLDEMLGREGVTAESFNSRLMDMYRPGATEVLTIHAETEGGAYRGLLRDLLARHGAAGIRAVTLGEIAAEAAASARAGALPARPVRLGSLPGRAGRVVVAA